jgi:hypothetical protein
MLHFREQLTETGLLIILPVIYGFIHPEHGSMSVKFRDRQAQLDCPVLLEQADYQELQELPALLV